MRRSGTLKGMARVTLEGFRCERCGHEWVPRDKEQAPTVCPKCKSPYWNKPRKGEEIPMPGKEAYGGALETVDASSRSRSQRASKKAMVDPKRRKD
jgi:DNA-directed RNA polymerase subunit RPC12/RpoP